ncbi:MAG: NifB/NifX family molybdenum-iron cluster-binding protein [Candidatus Omnitrophica bacterium]|nr:NifB/NifX family molybdenum-iron cluster-binding protein [Candidatus Omnitrophota bacterium]MDD5736946.1 NifB/NifX family molybdenum-iron cluster-binding protein [Candidatus Omnitrophota bacterium]
MNGSVCAHFGQCKYFLLADVDKDGKKVLSSRIVPNTAVHGGGGCLAVDEILKYDVTHIIAGGMGMGAQQKLAKAGVKVFGYSGKVQDAFNDLLGNKLGGLGACKEHGNDCH